MGSRCPGKKCPHTWLGLDDKAREGTFVWNDGTPLSGYNDWNRGEPNNYRGKEDCTHITKGNKWNDLSCSTRMVFICEVRPGSPPHPIQPPPLPGPGVGPIEPGLPVCKEGWLLSARGVCFGTDDTGKETYEIALAKCKKLGGTLAQPKTRADFDLILSRCPGKKCPHTWLGLDDKAKEGTFVWNDGTPLSGYNDWNRGEPNNYRGKEDCTHITKGNKWNDLSCSTRMVFVCEVRPESPPGPSPPGPGILPIELVLPGRPGGVDTCEEGWVWSPAREVCYGTYEPNKLVTYTQALAACRNRGGTLAQPKTAAEMQLILNVCPNKKCGDRWIGLDDRAKEGTFKWNDGTALSGYRNFHNGEPNNLKNEDCVHIWYNNQWNDRNCNKKTKFLCEIPAGREINEIKC